MKDSRNIFPKITFLFGAGAEIDYGLPSGRDFLKPLLTAEYSNQRKKLLGNECQRYQLVFPQSQKVFWKTIATHPKEASEIFEKDKIDKAIAKENEHSEKISLTDDCKKWYEKLTSENDSKEKQFFLDYAVFFESLDERFHYLQDGDCSSTQAKRVKNAYVTIFIELFSKVYLNENERDFNWSWKNILLKLKEKQTPFCDRKKETYYKRLRESMLSYNIATTNYTDFASEITGKEVVYLHGNLYWFEDLKSLTIYDARQDSEYLDKESQYMPSNILPFILIPSGVKPLICVKQIEEFHKFKKMLDNSEVLCVVGYAFNSEDNHVNAIIGDWLRQDKKRKLVFLDFAGKFEWDRLFWLEQFNRKELSCNNSSDVLNCTEQIISLQATGDRQKASQIFVSLIEQFKNKYSSEAD